MGGCFDAYKLWRRVRLHYARLYTMLNSSVTVMLHVLKTLRVASWCSVGIGVMEETRLSGTQSDMDR